MQDLLLALTGSDSRRALLAHVLAGQPLPPPALALCAWAWHRWAGDPTARPAARFRQLQANRLGWRAADDWSAALAVQAALAELLQAQMPGPWQWQALLRAAAVFNGIFPVEVHIGNGDTGGYELDCRQLWHDFAPARDWFAAALPLSETLRCEWVTLAQVFWSHFRWQADDPYHGTFSEPACGYLLAQAVALAVPYPVQYYYFYRQLPTPYTRHRAAAAGEELVLQSGLGLTYFYYAQYCQYHGADPPQALTYYQRFLAAEPACHPDNGFRLFSADAELRSYPPSVQEALTETGNLHRQLGDPAAARTAYEQAIATRPGNFQAPHGQLAALLWLARQAEAGRQASWQSFGWAGSGVGSWLHYDPTRPEPQVLDGYPGLGGWWLLAARVRVVEANELYRELADLSYYELADYPAAARYYKRYLAGLTRRTPDDPEYLARLLDASASQLRLAEEQGDYWQARALRRDPANAPARHCLARLRQRFAWGSFLVSSEFIVAGGAGDRPEAASIARIGLRPPVTFATLLALLPAIAWTYIAENDEEE